MNISAPFISRPVGTTLLTLALALVGIVAFALLPVSPLPQIDFPTIRVQAALPGASPETMAGTVATPLERSLGRIAGITEMTSSSSMGNTSIVVQFDLSRNIDGAARDVQAAINAARSTLPTLPSNPTYRKVNPADSPIMILALSSDSLRQSELYDVASTVLSQKISQLPGVGQVLVQGSALPAVRVELQPGPLNHQGVALSDVRNALAVANANSPKGVLDDGTTQWFVGANDQISKAKDYAPLVIRYRNGAAVRLSDVAEVNDSVQDVRNAAFANGKPGVVLIIFKQPGSNVIEAVKSVRDTLPLLRAWTPEGADFTVIMDRSPSITASLRDVEQTLVIAMLLVVLVVFLFLRNGRATIIPAVAVPVSLLGTFGIMYLCGFSLNHLSLMAMTIATGFVVDDAIVVTENIVRHIEDGLSPMQAAFLGSKEVAFTVVSISFSLVAIFIPILCMGGLLGRLFREFAVTLSAAVLVSLSISLITTPMMCAWLLRAHQENDALHGVDAKGTCDSDWSGEAVSSARRSFARQGLCRAFFSTWAHLLYCGFNRIMHGWGSWMDSLHEGYARTLAVVLRHRLITLLVLLATISFNVFLYIVVPKGFFPLQDTGQIIGTIQADQSISFQSMRPKLEELIAIVRSHPDVQAVSGYTGGAQRNSGFSFISLKPVRERKGSSMQVIDDLRPMLAKVPGAVLRLQPMQDLGMGGRRTGAMYQYTLQSDDLQLLRHWTPRITEAFSEIPGLMDVNSDQENHGLQTSLDVNRDTLARYGITQKQVDSTLGLAFGQSFASTIYTSVNQYRVVMEFAPQYWQGPDGLRQLYVPATGKTVAASSAAGGLGTGLGGNSATSQVIATSNGTLIPLYSIATAEATLTALSVSHQGQFTASTISFNLGPGVSFSDAQQKIDEAMFKIGVPPTVLGSFQGSAKLFSSGLSDQPILILAAFITLYIVLGILYESLIHPLTILSTLPSAGVGAILGLMAFGAEFSVIAFIGVLLLCGIVKKNAIMMIDFALEARRNEGLPAVDAIYKACLLRFRPIMMTTMAAVFGAVPLLISRGDGAELRTPLGITIVGGLLVSQVLTLYTTPVVYLYLDRFSSDRKRNTVRRDQGQGHGAEPLVT